MLISSFFFHYIFKVNYYISLNRRIICSSGRTVVTISRSGHEKVMQVGDDFPGKMVGLLDYGLRHCYLRVGQQGRKPLAVDVNAIPYGIMIIQR